MQRRGHILWTAGEDCVEDDFVAQAQLACDEGTFRTILVLSSAQLVSSLKVPASIAAHTDLIHFPSFNGRLVRLIVGHEELERLMKGLARRRNAGIDELAGVFWALHGTLCENNGKGWCRDLAAQATRLFPEILKPKLVDCSGFEYLEGFEEAVESIENFEYDHEQGFFWYEASGHSGTFDESCFSQSFRDFQQRVVTCRPSTIQEFESLL